MSLSEQFERAEIRYYLWAFASFFLPLAPMLLLLIGVPWWLVVALAVVVAGVCLRQTNAALDDVCEIYGQMLRSR
jgi:hypothetical protein